MPAFVEDSCLFPVPLSKMRDRTHYATQAMEIPLGWQPEESASGGVRSQGTLLLLFCPSCIWVRQTSSCGVSH